jgi:prolyl-tRNA synthetase
MAKSIVNKEIDYSQWYNDIVREAGLAEHSAVKGCMVIKPYGFGIWENIQNELDRRFKETGHQNAYFPLFVPKSFLSREAAHVEGFAKECAVVTHYRLKTSENGKEVVVDPDAKLEEELIVRPTSETIIWNTYKNWIQSYRDLPLLINQWANIVRWEMRTRLFLRTAEFLWQEGHTAHATREEAVEETTRMLDVYADFAREFLAIPVIKGVKSENERFAGAVDTYCIEAMMQDGKALQAGTSHFLGQNFAKAFDVKFSDKTGKQEFVWATSWGVSTRLIGGLIMTHSDNQGLVLPPKIAPIKVVIIPIYRKDEEKEKVFSKAKELENQLKKFGVSVKFDDDDTKKPGWKFAEHEVKGVPVRIALGPKDLEKNHAEVARRDTLQKEFYSLDDIASRIVDLLDEIQDNLLNKAIKFREENTHEAKTYDELKEILNTKGGFVWANWDGTSETEIKIKEETKATIRLIPLNEEEVKGKCIYSGKEAKHKVIFAKAY